MERPAHPPTLRPATNADCSSLAALSIEVWLGTYIREGVNGFFAGYVLSEFTADRFATLLAKQSEHIIVSDNSNGIDGFIRIAHGNPSPVAGGSETEIATLYVQPRHQGKAIGQYLLAAGLDFARQQGWCAPWLATNSQNTRALEFYQKQGFARVGQTHFQLQDSQYLNEVLQHTASE